MKSNYHREWPSALDRARRPYDLLLLGLALAALPGLAGAVTSALAQPSGLAAFSAWCGVVSLAVVSYGVFVHLIARVAWSQSPNTAPQGLVQSPDSSPVTVLVPVFREETKTLRKTLMAASLQTQPAERIVVLLDDVPQRDFDREHEALRALPQRLREHLAEERGQCERALQRLASPNLDLDLASSVYAELCETLADGIRRRATTWKAGDHSDRHFADTVLTSMADSLAISQETALPAEGRERLAKLREEVALLKRRFDPAFTVFERKRYNNLAATPDKAANLGAFLALKPGGYREVRDEKGRQLQPCEVQDANLVVPATERLALFDADTVVAPEYLETLGRELDLPGNADVAVVQSPYMAFPDAPGAVEQVAGATTNVQFLLHQGLGRSGAAFWVGANAMLRRQALESIAVNDGSSRLDARRLLCERTVIEDTETSLALREAGWRLLSVAEPLAFSATPPDFGSLVVQRTRWANGGFLLLGRLVRLALRGPRHCRVGELAMRAHYLVSLAPTALALLLLPVCLVEAGAAAALLPLMALSYFLAYADDLSRVGYRASDVLRVYALNLLLIPVNLTALLSSLRQAVTGRKIRFATTPKSGSRTPVAGTMIVAELGLLGLWGLIAVDVSELGRSLHTGLVLGHAGLLAYAISTFIGWQAAFKDLGADLAGNLVARRGVAVTDSNPI